MSILTERQVVLASASPRRLELLQQVGVEPQILVPQVKELQSPPPGDNGRQLVLVNARLKAEAAAALCGESDALVIAADTVVSCGGRVFGKPQDGQDAFRMLSELSGRIHSVFTGHWLIDMHSGASCGEVSETLVKFCPLTAAEIMSYIDCGDPLDKAGAYGIQSQGGVFIESIRGDYSTVVGLSLPLLYRLIRRMGAQERL